MFYNQLVAKMIKKNKHAFCSVLLLGILGGLLITAFPAETFSADGAVISSPDGGVKLKLEMTGRQLSYSVWFKDKPVIETSPIRLSLDDTAITSDVVIGKTEEYSLYETYPWYGVHALASF